jgi:hypothetical protein
LLTRKSSGGHQVKRRKEEKTSFYYKIIVKKKKEYEWQVMSHCDNSFSYSTGHFEKNTPRTTTPPPCSYS